MSGLTLDQLDRLCELRTKAAGIVGVVWAASTSNEVEPQAIPDACWAAADALREMKSILAEVRP